MALLEKWTAYNQKQIEIKGTIEQVLADLPSSELSLNEFYLLYYLNQSPRKKLNQFELPERLHLSASAVSRMISRLEAKNCGVIAKQLCDEDKRSTFIRITDHGQQIIAEAIKAVEAALTSYQQELSRIK
ncbi:MAG: MarR family transcriptional regulator [Aerococcus sp.]|nr:MarR family transcriptional regulator [Aerococcus sp.]